MVNLLQMIRDEKPETIINHIKKRIKEFELNPVGTDIRGKDVSQEIVDYYRNNYLKFRDFYNKSEKDIKDLYTLSFYSFCNLMRFNSKNEFNMPYGNRCFLESDDSFKIIETHKQMFKKNISFRCGDAFELLKTITTNENQFLYFDPPYTNSTAIYNENRAFGGWNEESDKRLFEEMDRLTALGIKWAYSNVLEIKGKSNNHIEEWASKNGYTIIELENKDYSSLGKGKANAREVLIINYKQRVKQMSIFDFLD